MLIRVLFFVGIVSLSVYTPFWLFTVGAVWYMFRYRGYELLVTTLLLDIFFIQAGAYQFPRYIAFVAGTYLIVFFIRQRILV